MIADLEGLIVGRLAAKLPDIRVEAFPDDPVNYRLRHPRGAILVGYGRASYGERRAVDIVVQDRRMEWDITVLARHLREHGGAYGHLDAVRIALTGFRPLGGEKLRPVRERFLGVKDGVWSYSLTMITTIPAMETASGEPETVTPDISNIERGA